MNRRKVERPDDIGVDDNLKATFCRWWWRLNLWGIVLVGGEGEVEVPGGVERDTETKPLLRRPPRLRRDGPPQPRVPTQRAAAGETPQRQTLRAGHWELECGGGHGGDGDAMDARAPAARKRGEVTAAGDATPANGRGFSPPNFIIL